MTAMQPFGALAALARPAADPALSIVADMSDCWPEFDALLSCDFLLGQHGVRSWAVQPGVYAAVALARAPIAGLGTAADFSANLYAASAYVRPAITGLGLVADFVAPAYAAAAYSRPAIAGLLLAADFSADLYAAN